MQVEAVENHMPEIIMVDEIGTEAEALACRTIAERGVQLVATAHGQLLENLIKNPTLSDLVGGIQSVTLGMLVTSRCTHFGALSDICLLGLLPPPCFRAFSQVLFTGSHPAAPPL